MLPPRFVGIALCLLPGCSYLFVDGPPPEHEREQYFDCTTSRAAPVIDSVFAGAYAISAAGQATRPSAGEDKGVAIAALLGAAIVDGVSAVHGFKLTAECETAKRQWVRQKPARGAGLCGSDRDCKGDRICEAGLCVQPSAPDRSREVPAASPAPATAPPAPITGPQPAPLPAVQP